MNVYILCPAYIATGGIELCHQMCNAINTLSADVEAYIWYTDKDRIDIDSILLDVPSNEEYRKYNTTCAKSMQEIDVEGNVVVFPEGYYGYIQLIRRAKRVFWWMSVDNFTNYNDVEKAFPFFRENVCLHLYQSFYSKDYVEKNMPDAKGIFLSDYINRDHGKFLYPPELRQDIALYNPKKGYEDLEPLINKADWLNWIPLANLPREKVIVLMQCAKIYVDFGHHPGKDRIPREAAANGCCIITNKKGAAAFYEDVSIPDKYKFESPGDSLDEIDNLLHDICNDFKSHQDDFASYRGMIASEYDKFNKDVLAFLECVKNI